MLTIQVTFGCIACECVTLLGLIHTEMEAANSNRQRGNL